MDGIEHSWTNHGEQKIGENKLSCLLTIFDAASVVREYLPKRRGIILRVLCEISVINFLVKRVEYNISRKQWNSFVYRRNREQSNFFPY